MKNVFFCGEDKRFIECCKELNNQNIKGHIISKISDIDSNIKPKIIVLPIQGINVINSFYHYIFSSYNNALFVYYNLTEEMKDCFKNYNLNSIDLSENFEFSKQNNIATAEASLKYIIEFLNINFSDIKVAILGYGKCGQEVYDLYRRLGMNCDVYIRRKEIKDKLDKDGYLLEELKENINKYDLIVNTIPHNIIDNDLLHLISLKTIMLDLASYPYGWNHEIAKYLGIYSYILKGLPGVHRYIAIGKSLALFIREKI